LYKQNNNNKTEKLVREFQHVFASGNLPNITDVTAELLALPTNQMALHDLVATGPHVELEKDRLLNVFMHFANTLCTTIVQAGYWADYVDPCSGLPMLTPHCHKVYSEVDGMECCLQYKSYNAGFCKVLTHPKWGTAVYPATIFVWAPRHYIVQLLQKEYTSRTGNLPVEN
jgi:Methylmalonic aciduria and homocystinuria type D protein